MNEWMNHPLLNQMDPAKRELIQMAASRTEGKSGKELMPIMMALITGANKKGIQFTSEETELFFEMMKEGKSAEEKAQIDRTIQMVRTLIKTHAK